MGWGSIILFLITNGPAIIKLIRALLDRAENRKDAKECIGELCKVLPAESDLGPLRRALRERLEKLKRD